MGASVFEFVAAALEQRTSFATLEARGTVRLALKQAGLDVRDVTAAQMAVMLKRVMPGELRARGIEGAERICDGLILALKDFRQAEKGDSPESPEDIFRRLAGR